MKIKFKIPVMLKNRTAVGIAVVVTAFVIGFVLVPIVNNLTSPKAEVKVRNTASNTSSRTIYSLRNGQYLISVSVKNIADSLSGKLQNGDIVSVIFPPDTGNGNSDNGVARLPGELQYVKVAAVTTSNGEDTDKAKVVSGNSSNNLPATVTLIVNSQQAQMLVSQESGTVHLALAYRGGGEKAQELLDIQENYFKQQSSSQAAISSDAAQSSVKDSSNSNAENNGIEVEVTK